MRELPRRGGRHRGQAGEPLGSAANRLIAPVGQHEVDRGLDRLAIDAEQFVGRAVGRGRMRRHAKALRNGLEVLLFFVDAVPGPPPPCLMHKRPVRRVHQPDDAVVDIAGQFRRQMRAAVPVAEGWQLRHGWQRIPGLHADPPATRLGAGRPRHIRLSPGREMRSRRCAGDRSPGWSTKGSPCTGRTPARRPSRDTCR